MVVVSLPLAAQTILILTCIVLFFKWITRTSKLPPGPLGRLPIIGHLPYLGKHAQEKLAKWGNTYGDVFSCYFGGNLVVVLNNYQSIKEAFDDDVYAARAQPYIFEEHFHGNGLTYAEGELWKVHRKFAILQMRNFGMGKNSLQTPILKEISEISSYLKKLNGQPTLAIQGLFTHHLSNVICSFAFGHRFAQEDQEFRRIVGTIEECFAIGSHDSLITLFPILRFVPLKSLGGNYKKFSQNFHSLMEFANKLVDNHESANDGADQVDKEPRDYIDAYLQQARNDHNEGNHDTTFTRHQLVTSIVNLFIGGTETTSTTLRWSLVFMIENPHVQEKVFREIESVVGRDRDVKIEDRANLPYTDATILEIQRCGNIATLGGSTMHKTAGDAYLRGFFIPKGTYVAPNFYAVHVDERMWTDASKFNPQRFLTENNKVKRPEGFIPFSIGKKACPGESLAVMELFLFFTNLIQKFKVQAPPGKVISSKEYTTGLTRAPINREICYTSRGLLSEKAAM